MSSMDCSFKYRRLLEVDFRSIIVFIAFVETGSLYSASLILGCSPSSVSIHLKRVRHYFNEPLFIREGRNLEPTEYAINLSQQLKTLFITFDTFVTESKD
ncbi:helix-turn-helix domain-containing protein [Citrobacter tructae]|uniref:LysR family transcriptional regulator n=2 Tax=Enterobacteriaceae TaxID=543 RepID=A0ABX5SZP3_9ENTR|nr:LysR family transcriptional regulator [Citrobacter tructae]